MLVTEYPLCLCNSKVKMYSSQLIISLTKQRLWFNSTPVTNYVSTMSRTWPKMAARFWSKSSVTCSLQYYTSTFLITVKHTSWLLSILVKQSIEHIYVYHFSCSCQHLINQGQFQNLSHYLFRDLSSAVQTNTDVWSYYICLITIWHRTTWVFLMFMTICCVYCHCPYILIISTIWKFYQAISSATVIKLLNTLVSTADTTHEAEWCTL